MEPTEISDFEEQVEAGREKRDLFAVSFSISVLAVLVALVTVLGHRAHTDAVLQQARATDEWNFYQAKKIRQTTVALTSDILSVLSVSDAAAANRKIAEYKSHSEKWDKDLADAQEKAEEFESRVEKAEARATRYDAGEALLQIAVVLSSVTLLTGRRAFWYMGLVFGLLGVLSAGSTLLLR